MKISKWLLIGCFLFSSITSYTQVSDFCNDDSCGALDPSWQLDGTRTVACEGVIFSLRSGESVPYDNIDSYTWILTNTLTGEELVRQTFSDTIPLDFEYSVNDSIACTTDRINIEVRLIVTSPSCGNGESCRYTVEPLTVIFKPRASFSSEQVVCINDPVSFTNQSCNTDTYAWDFNDDGITDSVDPDPTFSFSTPGSYKVSLTATNGCGSDIETKTIVVVGFPEGSIDLGANGGRICVPDQQTIALNANEWVTDGPSGFFNWEISPAYTNMAGDWCFVDPDFDGSGQLCLRDDDFTENTVDSLLRVHEQLQLYFRTPGEYSVTLNYGNICESLTVSETIYVYEPVAISGLSDLSGCDLVEVCFNDPDRPAISVSGNYESVEWVFENASINGTTNLDFGCISFQTSGTMTLLVKANAPCADRSKTIDVNIVTTQEVSVPNPSPNIICQNEDPIALNPSVSGGTYEYNNTLATFIVDDRLDPSGLAPGEYTINYILSDNPACPAEDSFSFSVQEGPSIELGENDPICESIANFNPVVISADGDIDAWQWTIFDSNGGAIATSANESPSFSLNTPDIYTIEARLISNECGSVADTSMLIIHANEQVVITPFDDPYCQNSGADTLVASPPGGRWFGTGMINESLGVFDPTALAPGEYTITYTVSDNPDCPVEDSFSFFLQEGPAIVLGGNNPVCESISGFNPVVLSAGGDIDAWQWTIWDSDGNAILTSTNEMPSFSLNVPDTYTIEARLTSNECGSVADTSTLIIHANEQVAITPFDNPYCQGSSADTLTATPPDGKWFGDGIVDEVLGIFDPTTLDAGNYPITYVIDNGACSAEATTSIQVVVSATVNVRDTFFCSAGEVGQLFVSETGGEFEGTGIVDHVMGLFDPREADIGNNSISYTLVDDNGCEVVKNIKVEVDDIPVLALNDSIFVCIDGEDVAITTLINVDTRGEEGTISYSGPGIVDTSLGTFNGSNLAPGFYTLYVAFEARACFTRDSFVVELAEKPTLTLPEDETVCLTEGTLALVANVPSGRWSSANCSIDPETGELDLGAIGEADCIFTYTLSAGTSCEQSEDVNISILDLSNDLQVPPPTSICSSSDLYTMPSFAPAAGTWSGEGMVDVVRGIIDVSLLNQDTSYTYTYCIEAEEIDCSACKETILTIEALPTADFELEGSPCQFQSFNVINTSTGAVSFEWYFESGDAPSTSNAPSHTYITAGQKTITLIAKTAFGCSDTLSRQVDVTAPPVLDVSILTDEGCAPLTIDYTNNSTGEGVMQYWIIDGIDTIQGAQPQIILDSVVTDSLITLELVVYNDCEVLRQSKEVLVHPYPLVDFGINDDEGCSPDTVFFMDATVGLPDSLLWVFGNGFESTLFDPPPQIYTSPDDSITSYRISLYASNECGDGFLEKEILVYPNNVDAFFEIDTLSGCPPLAVNIRNYATMGATITYDFGDGGTGNTGDTTYVYTEPGKYVITQYASLCGTDFRQSDTITVFPLAEIDFGLPPFACMGAAVQFTNTSTNGVVSRWDFGDGCFSDQMNPIHRYESAGTFEVSLIMNSTFNDCPDTLTKTILIHELPMARFRLDSTEICQGGSVSLQNESTGTLDYEWMFGKGEGGSEEENPVHSYYKPGIFEVKLKVIDENGCSADTSINNLLVHPNPIGSYALPAADICQFYDTLVVANTSEGYINSIWYLNDEFYADQQNELRVVSEDIGRQELALISISPFGCRDTQEIFFEVLPSPIAQASWADTSGCQKLTLPFIDLSLNTDVRTWYFDGDNTSSDSIAIHTFADHGIFPSFLIGRNSNGCPADTFSLSAEVFPRAIAKFELMPFDSCGVPVEIETINRSEFSTDYEWGFGNGNTSSFYEPLVEYIAHGSYLLTLTASNEYACADTAQEELMIFPFTVADFSLARTELCEGDTVQINNTSTGANEYKWLVNDVEYDDFPLVLTESGTYKLTLIASYDQHCHATYTTIEPIIIHDSPTANFTTIADESSDIIGDVRFINTSIDAESYQWEFGDGQTSSEENPEHEYNINGPATVCLYSFNNNNGLFQCVDKALEVVNFELVNTFYVPKALSPDQNFGNSEVGLFKPKGIDVEAYELNIYSPWGDKVATLNQVFDGEPTDAWDGTFQGKPVAQGAYLWTARIKYKSGHEDFKKGKVTVIR